MLAPKASLLCCPRIPEAHPKFPQGPMAGCRQPRLVMAAGRRNRQTLHAKDPPAILNIAKEESRIPLKIRRARFSAPVILKRQGGILRKVCPERQRAVLRGAQHDSKRARGGSPRLWIAPVEGFAHPVESLPSGSPTALRNRKALCQRFPRPHPMIKRGFDPGRNSCA
jgi:hypothetical protein